MVDDLFPATPPVRDLKLQNATALFLGSRRGFDAAQAIDRSPAAKNGWGNVGNPGETQCARSANRSLCRQ